jgi:hypothetical protein
MPILGSNRGSTLPALTRSEANRSGPIQDPFVRKLSRPADSSRTRDHTASNKINDLRAEFCPSVGRMVPRRGRRTFCTSI